MTSQPKVRPQQRGGPPYRPQQRAGERRWGPEGSDSRGADGGQYRRPAPEGQDNRPPAQQGNRWASMGEPPQQVCPSKVNKSCFL